MYVSSFVQMWIPGPEDHLPSWVVGEADPCKTCPALVTKFGNSYKVK